MTRPTFDEIWMQVARVVAQRATCDRKHVGAVIVDAGNHVIATGYNGAPRGMPHCDDAGHELKKINGRMSCVRTLHAESNALQQAGRMADGATLYVTVTPCYPCAQRIVNAGIIRVVYGEWYDSQNTDLVAEFLEKAGVELVESRQDASMTGRMINIAWANGEAVGRCLTDFELRLMELAWRDGYEIGRSDEAAKKEMK